MRTTRRFEAKLCHEPQPSSPLFPQPLSLCPAGLSKQQSGKILPPRHHLKHSPLQQAQLRRNTTNHSNLSCQDLSGMVFCWYLALTQIYSSF